MVCTFKDGCLASVEGGPSSWRHGRDGKTPALSKLHALCPVHVQHAGEKTYAPTKGERS